MFFCRRHTTLYTPYAVKWWCWDLFCHHYPCVSVWRGGGGGEIGRTRRQEGVVRKREKIRTWLAKGGLKLSPVGRGSAPSPVVWKCVSEDLRREACMLHTRVCKHFSLSLSLSLSLSRDPWSYITFNTYQERPAEQVIKSKQKREEREREASEKDFVGERHNGIGVKEKGKLVSVCVCEDSCRRK